MKKVAFVLLMALLSLSAIAQKKFRLWTDTSKNTRRILLPIIVFSPETHAGIGVIGVSLWKNSDSTHFVRTSNAEIVMLYTSRKQVIFLPHYTIFTKREKYWLDGYGEELIHFRDYYFGVGNTTPERNREVIRYDALGWENRIGRRIFANRNLFLGLETRLIKYFNFKNPSDGLLDTTKVAGYKGSTSLGLGPALIWDSRDNVVNPSKGFYWDIRYAAFSKSVGSTYDYHRLIIDFRKYFNVLPTKRQILAFEVFGTFVRGNAPFKELAELGGPRIMRGYYRGRYRDDYLTAFQAEYRIPLTQRFGVVGFAGFGKVYNPKQMNLENVHCSYGTGLRMTINKRERLNLRLDYALGDYGDHAYGYLYLGLAESF